MSEQSPERAGLNEEPEVEGHSKMGQSEDPSVFAALNEEEDPEVEGHMKALKAEDPARKG